MLRVQIMHCSRIIIIVTCFLFIFCSDGGISVAKQSLRSQKGLMFGEGSSDIKVYDHISDLSLNDRIREVKFNNV